MNHNQFPRGTVAEHSPLDSVDTARDIVHTLGVNGEAVELSPEQRSVETAFTVDDAIEQGVKEENPDLAGPDLAKEIDGRVADLVRDSRDPEVPREGRVEAAVVGIVDETRRPGGEVADVLAEDPETFTEAVEVSLEGGMSPETLEKVVAGVTAREEIKAWVEEDGATKEGLLSPFGPGTNPDTGNFDVRFMPRSGDAEQNQIHNKIRNDTTLTVMEGIRSGRDKVTRQLGEVELLPDRVYRGTDAEEVRNLLIEGKLMSRSLDDEYEEAEEGSNNNKGIDWYLGGASQRYGEVFLEAPARPDYVGPKRDNGTRLASGGYVRHFHSSGRNHPIPEQEVTIIAKKIDSNEYERMSPREFIASLDAEQPTENIQQKTTSARGDMAGKEMLAYPAADVLAEDPETFTEAVEVSLEGGMSPETLEKVVAGVTAREGVAEDSPKDSHSTPASEFGGVPEFIVSPEQVKADTMRRIDIPMELRKGQEVADPDTGETLKPAIEVYFDESMMAEVQQKIHDRRKGMTRVSEILDAFDALGVGIDDPITPEMLEGLSDEVVDALVSDESEYPTAGARTRVRSAKICDILRDTGVNGANIDMEDHTVGGDVADLYTTADDISHGEALTSRLAALGDDFQYKDPFTKENVAERMEAFVDSVIPDGTQLFHTTREPGLKGILEDGMLSTRIHQGEAKTRGHSQGRWSNFVHFGEAGKINGQYGPYAIGIPIEEIMAKTPYACQEPEIWSPHSTDPGAAQSNYYQRYAAINIPLNGENTSLVVQRRKTSLESRYKDGFVLQGSRGNKNNLAFAATLDQETAGVYGYSIDSSTIIYGKDETGHRKAAIDFYGKDRDLTVQSLTPMSSNQLSDQVESNTLSLGSTDMYVPTGTGSGVYGVYRFKSDFIAEVPRGITHDALTGYAPIAAKSGGPGERDIMELSYSRDQEGNLVVDTEEERLAKLEAAQAEYALVHEAVNAEARAKRAEALDAERRAAGMEHLSDSEWFDYSVRRDNEAKAAAAAAGLSIEEYEALTLLEKNQLEKDDSVPEY